MRVVFGARGRRVRRRRRGPSRLRWLFSGRVRPGADACTDADADVISHVCPDRVGGADARTKSLADAGAYVVTELCAESSAEFRTIAVSYVSAELNADVGPDLRADVSAEPRANAAPDHILSPEQCADRSLQRLHGERLFVPRR